jgi:hypothetical protein
MKGLLVLTAILLLVAGLVKLRAAERIGLGLAVLPLVEILAGFALGGVALSRPPSPGGGLVMVILAVGLILLSSIQVGLAMQARRRLRQRSEATRLQTFMTVRSGPPTGPERLPPTPPGAGTGSPGSGAVREENAGPQPSPPLEHGQDAGADS